MREEEEEEEEEVGEDQPSSPRLSLDGGGVGWRGKRGRFYGKKIGEPGTRRSSTPSPCKTHPHCSNTLPHPAPSYPILPHPPVKHPPTHSNVTGSGFRPRQGPWTVQ
ncbi:unnamed protein product [Gadus morhua 'NCC']